MITREDFVAQTILTMPIESIANDLYTARKYAQELEQDVKLLEAKTDNRPKLTDRDVQLIKRFLSTTGLSDRELAESFGVNPRTIGRIRTGEYHKDK